MKPAASERPKQDLPADIIGDLMTAVRNGFYPGNDAWFADQSFIRRRVVTWPAGWLNKRGVTLKPERYKEILLGIFTEIKRHGQTGTVKYWPGYLVHCVQEHFKYHGEEIYNEAKALRNKVEAALLAGKRATDCRQGNDPVAALALVHQTLTAAHKRKQKPSAAKAQMDLL
jgi:hypothetical protein